MKRCIATFSIVGYDPENGDLGVAVQSKFLAVGAVVPWAKAGVGAVATQALANPAYGPEGLALLEQGLPAAEVVSRLVAADEAGDVRQLGVVDAAGDAAAYTGAHCLPWAGHRRGACCTVQGNILVGEATVDRMLETFAYGHGDLADRLTRALAAGQDAGGDSRGRQAAALLVAREHGGYNAGNDRFVDIRVDDHPEPITELERILRLWRATFTDRARAEEVEIDRETALMVQAALRRAGLYDGPRDGHWSETVASGAVKFAEQRGLGRDAVTARTISGSLLAALISAYQQRLSPRRPGSQTASCSSLQSRSRRHLQSSTRCSNRLRPANLWS